MTDRLEIPVAEAVAGDWVVYFSQARPAGQVTRKVIGKTRDTRSGQWMIRVSWRADKTEAIPANRIKCCLRDADVQNRLVAAQTKETDFRSKLLEGLGIKRG